MEKDLSKKFVCKYCHKRYPSGKSLGGHLRSHRNVNSVVNDYDDEKAKLSEVFARSNNKIEFKSLGEVGEQSQSETAYILRETPKKTWRFSISGNSGNSSLQQQPQEQLKVCKECGKGFQSVKALCGHMACHSDKDKKSLVMDDDESDFELSALRRPRTSKRNKDRALDVYTWMNDEGCSSVSEQMEVAWCLMILSRDSRNWGGVNSAGSSDDNSIKSSSAGMDIIRKDGLTRISSFGEYKGNKNERGRELDNAKFELSNDYDDKYFEGEVNNAESDNSGELFLRDMGHKKPKARHESVFKGFVSQSRCTPIGYGHLNSVCRKKLVDEVDYEQEYGASKKYKTRGADEYISFNKYENGSSIDNVKVYRDSGYESMSWSSENSQDTDPCFAQTSVSKPLQSSSSKLASKKELPSKAGKKPKPRKSKGHKCPFCFKIFRSGQALGGHKRIHLVGGSEDRTFAIKQEMPDLFDRKI